MTTVGWLLIDGRLRKANKPHACQSCERDIEVGERYISMEEPDYTATRYHIACGQAGTLILGDEQPRWHRQSCALPWIERQSVDAAICPCGGTPAPYERVEVDLDDPTSRSIAHLTSDSAAGARERGVPGGRSSEAPDTDPGASPAAGVLPPTSAATHLTAGRSTG